MHFLACLFRFFESSRHGWVWLEVLGGPWMLRIYFLFFSVDPDCFYNSMNTIVDLSVMSLGMASTDSLASLVGWFFCYFFFRGCGSLDKGGMLYLFVILSELSEDEWEASMVVAGLLEQMTFSIVTIRITNGLEWFRLLSLGRVAEWACLLRMRLVE